MMGSPKATLVGAGESSKAFMTVVALPISATMIGKVMVG